MSVPPFLMRAFYLHMRDEGLPVHELLRGAPAHCDPTRAALSYDSLWEALQIARACGASPTLALEMGAHTPLGALGLLGELVSHSATLRSALASVKRYLPVLQTGGELRLVESGDEATLYYEPNVRHETERRFAIEMAFAMMVAIGKQFLGRRASPKLITLPFAAPPHAGEYARYFPCPVTYSATTASICCDRSFLDVRQPLADEYHRVVLETELERNMRSELPRAPLNARIRAILERDGKLPTNNSLRAVSRRLGMTPRAVRRRLAAEGLTLTGLANEVRKGQALHFVADLDLPLKNIADRMGFSDCTAFHRAFKRWTGTTPKQFRQTCQTRASAA